MPSNCDLKLNLTQVDAEKVAKQLGLRLSSIPPRFTEIRKRYNIHVKVVNAGALQRKKTSEARRLEGDASTDGGSPRKSEGIEGEGRVETRAPLPCSHGYGTVPETDMPSIAHDGDSLLL